ncbi:MAG TPA: 2-C-methyl-D-erythritol 4-phosphate cytidylyltransferase [Gemmatimonadales bacterium]|nr:2-C-methyl-D-erythritol 4-phosphate cytidylyltransferase [Gemmatimonadales bacterium]
MPAAGRGERAGTGEPKQFRPIAGVPMLLRAIRPFAQHPRVREIVVALPSEFAAAPPPWLSGVAGDRLRLVAGGLTRAGSVRAGLAALSVECRIVLVHDAARPFVAPETVEAVIARAMAGVGAVAAVPVADTLKRVNGARVAETVARQGLWRAQTPQGFPRELLERAYQAWGLAPAGADVTDDASIVEAAGLPVEVVVDRTTNFKITTPEDFAMAEALATR